MKVKDILDIILKNGDFQRLIDMIGQEAPCEAVNNKEIEERLNQLIGETSETSKYRIIFAPEVEGSLTTVAEAYEIDDIESYSPGVALKDAASALSYDVSDPDKLEQLLKDLRENLPGVVDITELDDAAFLNAEVDIANILSLSALHCFTYLYLQREFDRQADAHSYLMMRHELMKRMGIDPNDQEEYVSALRHMLARDLDIANVFLHMKGIKKEDFYALSFPMSMREFLLWGSRFLFADCWLGEMGSLTLEEKIDFLNDIGDYSRPCRDDIQVVCYKGYWPDGSRATFIRAYRTGDILSMSENIDGYFSPLLPFMDCKSPVREFLKLDPDYIKDAADMLPELLPSPVIWKEENKEFFDFQICSSQRHYIMLFYEVLFSCVGAHPSTDLYCEIEHDDYESAWECFYEDEEDDKQALISLFNLVSMYSAMKSCRQDIIKQAETEED